MVASRVHQKTKYEILEELMTVAQPGTAAHEQQKSAITVRCTEDIERALNSLETQLSKNAQASDRLGKKVLWLNWVLAGAAILGTLANWVIAMKG